MNGLEAIKENARQLIVSRDLNLALFLHVVVEGDCSLDHVVGQNSCHDLDHVIGQNSCHDVP